jgi:hypothetical protein
VVDTDRRTTPTLGLNQPTFIEENSIMFKKQYQELGTGEVRIWRKLWWIFGYTVEVMDNRKYAIEEKLNKKLLEMQGLYDELDDVFEDIIAAKHHVTNSSQHNCSEWMDIPVKKDSRKYRGKRSKPMDLWEMPREAIVAARTYASMQHQTDVAVSGFSSEIVGRTDQEVGKPVNGGNNKADQKAQRRAEHQANIDAKQGS